MAFSLDCVYAQSGYDIVDMPISFLKIIVFGILPIILSICGALIWGLIGLC